MEQFNPFSLIGKQILVTGASSGIGRGIAIACAKIRNYPGSESKCDYCPLYAYDHCTLTDSTPQSATYLFRARRLDDELQRLLEEA